MYIKCGDDFKKFYGFDKHLAECLFIVFDNSQLKCSCDHKFISDTGKSVMAAVLKRGDKVRNADFSLSTVISVKKIGQNTVYTPVNVDGEYYQTINGLINHNCSFIGSSPTLISGNTIEKLIESEPVEVLFDDLSLNIYLKPKPGALYVMGVDCCSGVGGDYACIQVIEIRAKNDMEQAAMYRSNIVKPGEFSRKIDYISKMYNNAYYILENNDVGKQVAEELWYTLENTNMINTEKAGHGLGTKADKRSKLDACMELQRVMDAGFLKIHDAVTIKEISTFEEQNTPNVFKASKGNHDDTVSALYWAVYATMQPEIDMDNIRHVETVKEQDELTVDMMVDMNENNDNFWADFK